MKKPRRRPARPYTPPAASERLYVRLEPRHVALLTFLLEARDHLALPTVVDRFAAVVRLLFSPDARTEVEAFLEDLLDVCPEAVVCFRPSSCFSVASAHSRAIGELWKETGSGS